MTWQHGYLKALLKTLTLRKEQVLNTELTSIQPISNLRISVSDTCTHVHTRIHGHAHTETCAHRDTHMYIYIHLHIPKSTCSVVRGQRGYWILWNWSYRQWSAGTSELGIDLCLTPLLFCKSRWMLFTTEPSIHSIDRVYMCTHTFLHEFMIQSLSRLIYMLSDEIWDGTNHVCFGRKARRSELRREVIECRGLKETEFVFNSRR
jgi:hypothetical protein